MSEEETQADSRSEEESGTPSTSSGLDDKRFEVKWRKKETSSSMTEVREAEAVVTEALTPEQLERELQQTRERVDQLRDRWQRAAADLANLRRRTEEEKGEVEKFANMLLVAELL